VAEGLAKGQKEYQTLFGFSILYFLNFLVAKVFMVPSSF